MVDWLKLQDHNPEPSLLDAIEWADSERPLAVGDLVYVTAEAGNAYKYTTPGSWGYIAEECDGLYVSVDWAHIVSAELYRQEWGDDIEAESGEWHVLFEYLRRLDNPPNSPEEITALVSVLARINGAL